MNKIIMNLQENINHYKLVMNDKNMSASERRKAKLRMDEMLLAQSIITESDLYECDRIERKLIENKIEIDLNITSKSVQMILYGDDRTCIVCETKLEAYKKAEKWLDRREQV